MKKTLLAGCCTGALLALAAGLVQSAPKPGATLQVRALQARIMNAPQFMGTSVATLRRGAQVQFVKADGSWYQVSYRGQTGWIHENRVTDKEIKLRSGDTGGGTSRGEAELAGRGFGPSTEAGYKSKNPKLDYSHLDKIQQADLEPESVAKFQEDGEVKAPKGGGR